MTPQVTVDRNYVVIQGVRIERQASCSPSEWVEFWTQVDDGHQGAVDWTNMSGLARRELKAEEIY